MNQVYNEKLRETVFCDTHKSGLRVYVMPKKGYSKSYAIFGTRYGSIDSDFVVPGQSKPTAVPDGIAHFLEHKMFEQPDGGNVFASYAEHGASANAFTSFNMTAYLFESTQDVLENLEILLDFVQKPYFTDENVAKEQGIIGQEIRMYDDDPGWQLMMGFLSSMYHTMPVRRDIAGTVESISKITKDTLYTCYNTFYNPSNMVLFVIGDVSPDAVWACVDKNARMSEPQGEIKRIYGDEPDSILKAECKKKLSVSTPMFMFGFKDTDVGFDGAPMLKKNVELSVLAELLFGKSGRLYNRLYEGGHIMGFMDAELECEKYYGYTVVSGESKDPEKVREIILEEIGAFRRDGISEADFERVKRAFWGRFVKQFNNITGVAHNFLSNIFNGIHLFDYVDAIGNLSLRDVSRRLEAAYDPDKSVLSVIEPVE